MASPKQQIKDFRKTLAPMIERAADLMADLDALHQEIDALREDLQSAYDDLSEKAQESDAGQQKQERLEKLESACDKLDYLLQAFDDNDLNDIDGELAEAEQ